MYNYNLNPERNYPAHGTEHEYKMQEGAEHCKTMPDGMILPGMGVPAQCPPMECSTPIVECPIEKVCHRQINHQVNRIQPIHTRIINHHIFHHTCIPRHTCSEEHVCTHVCCPPMGIQPVGHQMHR